jgi:hypothetical protein
MSWKIYPVMNPPQFSDEVKAYAKDFALTEVLKQPTELQDVAPDYIQRLGQKWQNHCFGVQRRMLRSYSEQQFDGLLILAWRVNRFAHYYEAALIRKTLELSGKEPSELEKELSTSKGCEKHYECGMLVAQHYTAVIGRQEMLQGTGFARFPDTGKVLEALSVDCIMHAALCLPDDFEKALDLLADAVSANDLALQGALQLDNFFNRKAERVINGKAGAQKRHAPTAELKAWTLQKYREGTYKSANQAASELVSAVLAQSQKMGAGLSKSNAQRTIAEWIRKSA